MAEQTAERSGSNVGPTPSTWPGTHAFAYVLRRAASDIEAGRFPRGFEMVDEFRSREGTAKGLVELFDLDPLETLVALQAIETAAFGAGDLTIVAAKPVPTSADGLETIHLVIGGERIATFRGPSDPKLLRYHPTVVASWIEHVATVDAATVRYLAGLYEIAIPDAATLEESLEQTRSAIATHLRGAKLWEPDPVAFEGDVSDGIEDTAPFARSVDEPISITLTELDR